jgi:hypothetical protein
MENLLPWWGCHHTVDSYRIVIDAPYLWNPRAALFLRGGFLLAYAAELAHEESILPLVGDEAKA